MVAAARPVARRQPAPRRDPRARFQRPTVRERLADRAATEHPIAGSGVGILAVVGYLGAFVVALVQSGGDVIAALVFTALLLAVSFPALSRIAAQDGMPGLKTLLVSALVLKLAGAMVRYGITFNLYEGEGDAERYHLAGAQLADQFRSFDFDLGEGSLIGTRFTEVLTGVVYSITGVSRTAGFLVFGWLGFWGLVWFYRAFRIAVPTGQHRLYAYLVLLLPSLLFWPSSIGKEAWMVSTLGLAAYGAARYLTGQLGGLTRLGLGLWGAAMVRPHVVLLFLAGLALAVVFRPASEGQSARGALQPLMKIFVVIAIAIGFVAAMGRSEERFEVGEARRAESLGDVRDYANEKSDQGGSTFDAEPVRSPIDFPMGMVSVLFRPLPHEAKSAQMMLSALEGTALMLFALARWRTIVGAARNWRALPYIAVSGAFIVGFVWGFSSFGNFGILVRQRVQVYPFVLAILCCPVLPAAARRVRRARPQARAAGTRRRPVAAHA